MRAWIQMLVVAVAALIFLGAMTESLRDAADVGDEIRIGNLMPYTGALSAFAAIGKVEAAYFDRVNAQGGINGRKLRFISHDDNSDLSVALDLTRGLVERDHVHLIFGSFGTPGNLAVQSFLNERKIPQLFVALRR
jgi:branched-chain amino acid transport system substrate-binding protein